MSSLGVYRLMGAKLAGTIKLFALADQAAGFIGEPEVSLPLRIGHHGSTLARAVGHILEHPQMNESVDVSALAMQIGEWRPEIGESVARAPAWHRGQAA